MTRRAKIVATLGPASTSEAVMRRLLRAGVDVVRLNLSHGSHDEHRERIRRVRKLAAAEGRHIAVLLDLMGPRFRLGVIADGPRLLRKGQRVVLGKPGPGVDLPVDDSGFLRHLRRGERVLIDNGLVELRVTAKRRGRVEARVLFGGKVSTRKGINLPETNLPFSISRKDRADIQFAVAERADYLAASYIGRGRELEALRRVARRAGIRSSRSRRWPASSSRPRSTAGRRWGARAGRRGSPRRSPPGRCGRDRANRSIPRATCTSRFPTSSAAPRSRRRRGSATRRWWPSARAVSPPG
jgi:pyruvate kinase